jgi:hypothetical protein
VLSQTEVTRKDSRALLRQSKPAYFISSSFALVKKSDVPKYFLVQKYNLSTERKFIVFSVSRYKSSSLMQKTEKKRHKTKSN